MLLIEQNKIWKCGQTTFYKKAVYSLKFAHQLTYPGLASINLQTPAQIPAQYLQITLIMASKLFIIGSVIASALASPFPEPQLSLPPLIPESPASGTIIGALPPGVILQPPTPPLASPPFVGSDIKPKKIGYFWTGAGDNNHKGVPDVDSRSFPC